MTKGSTAVILHRMKTAISLPDILYDERHNGQTITEKINAVYEKIDQKEFDQYLNIVLEPVRDLTKNDTW